MKTNKDFSKLPQKSTKKKNEDVKKGLSRLIKLMIDLNQGVLNLDHAAKECGVSRRTIQRDIETLEQAGLPLYKPNKQNVNYRVRDDFEWAKFNITKDNLLYFADAIDSILKNHPKEPFKWVLPIQKEIEKAGRAAQKKRNAEYKQVYFNTTDELFISSFLAGNEIEQIPYQTLLLGLEACRTFNEKEKNEMYANWQNVERLRCCARLSWLNRQYKEALFFCDSLIETAPKDPFGYRQAVLICYTLKDHQKAYKYILDGLEQNKTDIVLHFYWIYFCMLDKQYDDAIRLFNLVCKGKFWRTHFAALMYAYEGQFDKALEVVSKAQKADPKNPKAYEYIKGQVLDLKTKKQ